MPIPTTVAEPSDTQCAQWGAEELKKNYAMCLDVIERSIYVGCPRQKDVEEFGAWHRALGRRVALPDSWWARAEVNGGITGWEYDVCCSGETEPSIREELHRAGYCDERLCEYNKDAEFCIVSSKSHCNDLASGELIEIYNQCCYERGTGRLLNSTDDPLSSGRIHLEKSSLFNIQAHYQRDIVPFRHCCSGQDASNNCENIYKRHRPTAIGGYWPKNIVTPVLDPHYETADGLSYSFMGLGVYTMFTSTQNNSTTMQVSTRRIGNGTVFTGFVIDHNSTKLEAFIHKNSTIEVYIDGEKLDLGQYLRYTKSGIEVTEDFPNLSFKFHFLDISLTIEAKVTMDFFNFFILLPDSFENNLAGLMGNFDGDKFNDFQTPGKKQVFEGKSSKTRKT